MRLFFCVYFLVSSLQVKQTVFIPSGAGAPGFAGICKELQQLGGYRVVAGDMRTGVYGASLADEFVVMPSSMDEGYVEAVIRNAKEFAAGVILPITTAELMVLSKNRKQIEESTGATVIVSEINGLEIANNKGRLYEFCEENGFRVPAFDIVSNCSEFEDACSTLGISHRDLCFKPVIGNGSRGFGLVSQSVNDNWLVEKAGLLALDVDEWKKRLPDGQFENDLLLSVYLPGIEFSIDMLCENGKVLKCFPRSRDKMIGGISVAGTWMREEKLMGDCVALAGALGLHGVIGMQWKMGVDGELYLLEINPRLQGTTCALNLVGEHLAVDTVNMALGKRVDEMEGMETFYANNGEMDINYIEGATLESPVGKKTFQGWGKSFVRFWEERLL